MDTPNQEFKELLFNLTSNTITPAMKAELVNRFFEKYNINISYNRSFFEGVPIGNHKNETITK